MRSLEVKDASVCSCVDTCSVRARVWGCVRVRVCLCVCAKGKHIIVVPSWMVEVHEANLLTVVHTIDVRQGLCPSSFREYLRVQFAWIPAQNDQKLSKIVCT